MPNEYSGPQRRDESDSEYIKRMGRVAREQERIRRDQRQQDRLEAGAAEEREARAERADRRDLDKFVREATGGTGLDEIQRQYAQGKLHGPQLDRAMADVKKAQRARGVRARNRRTKAALKKHKGTIKTAGKQAKKNQGCAVAAVMMLGAIGGAGWAVWEAGSAIVSALGH